jgi:hypothetical protein
MWQVHSPGSAPGIIFVSNAETPAALDYWLVIKDTSSVHRIPYKKVSKYQTLEVEHLKWF